MMLKASDVQFAVNLAAVCDPPSVLVKLILPREC